MTALTTAPQASTPPAWRAPTRLRSLGPAFAVDVPPTPLPGLHWVARNEALATQLGLGDWLAQDNAMALLGGQTQPPVGSTQASVYSGHQFGVWAGQLGDGRALLLGEWDTPVGPLEVQLKGAGRTPFSRMGDGRAVLRSSIREYLCSEAMHGLGIATTRALALVGSPALVRREALETAAVVTRLAPSFIRFGHFEHFAHTRPDTDALQTLLDAVITHHYPDCQGAATPALALLEAVSRRTARLLADWQAVGFCHGVMNTDNMSILGLTIDYGPFGFLDAFDPGHICNHTDERGRYAFARQPSVAFWNLHALAQALMPLVNDDTDALQAALEPYKIEFEQTMLARLRAKLGLQTAQAEDGELADDLLRLMAQDGCDHTITWRELCRFDSTAGAANTALQDRFIDRAAWQAWAERYRQRLQAEASNDAARQAAMLAVNPKFVLRNHLAETAIRQAQGGDFSEIDRLMKVLQRPFDEHPDAPAAYAGLPPDWAQHLEVSCSS